jgi:hypothetical protein
MDKEQQKEEFECLSAIYGDDVALHPLEGVIEVITRSLASGQGWRGRRR